MIERRRSHRTVMKTPLEVRGPGVHRFAVTADISELGAVILSPAPLAAETQLQIKNLKNGVTTQGRVVWCRGDDLTKFFKVGIEFSTRAPEFWASDSRQCSNGDTATTSPRLAIVRRLPNDDSGQ